MGIKVEYNPDLALRNISEFKKGERKEEECIPESLINGRVYGFLKKGQRNYWLEEEIPLLDTKGEGQLSKPLASVIILEATHFVLGREIWTKGKYRVVEVFTDASRVYFNGFARVK